MQKQRKFNLLKTTKIDKMQKKQKFNLLKTTKIDKMQKFILSKSTKKRKNNPDALLYRNQGNLKDLYYETFLAYF